MSEIRTHEQVVGIVCTLAMEAHDDAEHEREEYGTRTRQAMRWLEATDAALRAEVERLRKALGYITDISEANADRAIVEMKAIAHEALDSAPAEEGK